MLYLDFETRGSKDLKKTSSHVYVEDPDFCILCAAWAVDDGPINTWLPSESMPKEFREADLIVAHGVHFESAVWTRMRQIMPEYDRLAREPKWECTASLCRARGLPGNLKAAALLLFGEAGKTEEDARILKLFSRPANTKTGTRWTEPEERPEEFEHLKQYNRNDVYWCREFRRALKPLGPTEQKIWAIDHAANTRGVLVDAARARRLDRLADVEKKRLTEEALKLGVRLNGRPTQRPHPDGPDLITWCAAKGTDLKNLQADYLKEVLQGITNTEVADMIRRKISAAPTSTAKLKALLRGLNADNRYREALVFNGAHTGRWTGSRAQLQNPVRGDKSLALPGKKLHETIEVVLSWPNDKLIGHYGPKLLSFISAAVRSCLVASPGTTMIAGDYSKIELAVCYWLAGDSALELLRRGEDPYINLAARVYGKDPESVTDQERQLGKKGELGCIYGMGDRKFHATCAKDGLLIAPSLAERTVQSFRAGHPLIVQFWRWLENGAMNAVRYPGTVFPAGRKIRWKFEDRVLKCRLPSGRCLYYRQPCLKDRKTPWGEVRPAMHHLVKSEHAHDWRIEPTYGGKFCENVTQATARDVLGAGLIATESAGYQILFTTHDEIVAERENADLDEFAALMSMPPEWAQDLPLTVDCWAGERYRK